MLPRGIIVLLFATGAGGAAAQVLFDAGLGTSPETQGWSLFAPPPMVSGLSDGAYLLDSRPAGNPGRGGISREAPSALDAIAGYSLQFSLRVEAESHASVHRSGASLIVLGMDRRGIELAFWTDRVWTQADEPLFTHAEEALIDTTRGFIEYTLSVSGDAYAVAADGAHLLSGPLRDYTSFSGFPDVYEIPNLLFLGDNTTSAAGAVSFRRMELLASPSPTLKIRGLSRFAVELSWASTAADWTLEATTEPSDPAGWGPAPEVPVGAGGILSVEIPVDSPTRFFRLRR